MFLLDWLFRPKPEFSPGQKVLIDKDFDETRYLLVDHRRWARPSHAEKKQWVYDGPILVLENGQFSCITYGYCFREEALAPILEYGSASTRLFEG